MVRSLDQAGKLPLQREARDLVRAEKGQPTIADARAAVRSTAALARYRRFGRERFLGPLFTFGTSMPSAVARSI
jgi:hypothetical protein